MWGVLFFCFWVVQDEVKWRSHLSYEWVRYKLWQMRGHLLVSRNTLERETHRWYLLALEDARDMYRDVQDEITTLDRDLNDLYLHRERENSDREDELFAEYGHLIR
jgi:hypothetical protein